ncbi:serine hydrolase [Muricauda sp. JGD-17]|uniref:Serine hydrolase n=1 Tax=Flagellimonas ochracea TaxID=2696472 RepID=A0A964TED6_9FLAO|nr:serine hydrolase domain-containing protein [Allomuricauda ochracea]NAY92654.1 serine hydrolase [Allomuricauda ochracea]
MKGPTKLFTIGLTLIIMGCSSLKNESNSEKKLVAEKLKVLLDSLTSNEKFSGTILLAEKGNVLFEKAYGMADRNRNILNKIDTKFNIASLGKIITKIAILILQERGQIDLKATIDTYTEVFPNEIGSTVTIQHLIFHRSGWSHYWNNDYFNANMHNLKSIDDYMVFIKDIPLEFKPGSQERYSNTGYEVLGHIIEKASGMSYHDFVQQNILDKANMSNTGAFERDGHISNVAIGYYEEANNGQLMANTRIIPVKGTAAGGSYSTVNDFLKLENALFNGKLLNEKGLKLLFSQSAELSGELPSGIFGVAGGARGASTNWVKDFGTSYSIFVFSNFDMGTARPISEAILEYTKRLSSNHGL